MANRLSAVIASTVSLHQNAFVQVRQILDAVLVANEVVEDVRGRKRKGVVFKLDFEKAYDRVSQGLGVPRWSYGEERFWREMEEVD